MKFGILSLLFKSDDEFFAMRRCLKFPDNYKRSKKEFVAPDKACISETVD